MDMSERHEHLRTAGETGFTLIELLVTMFILGIIAMLSLESVRVYRQGAYKRIVEVSMRDARTALIAGSSELEELAPGWYSAWKDTPGTVVAWGGEKILPGYINPPNVSVWAMRSTWCEVNPMDWCASDIIVTRHCKAGRMVQWIRWTNGIEVTSEFPVVPTC